MNRQFVEGQAVEGFISIDVDLTKRWSYLWSQSTSITGATRAEESANNNGSNRLAQGQAKLRAENTNWHGADMACHGKPHQKHVDDGRRPLVFFLDPIDTLRLNAHFPVKPLLTIRKVAEKALVLQLMCSQGFIVN